MRSGTPADPSVILNVAPHIVILSAAQRSEESKTSRLQNTPVIPAPISSFPCRREPRGGVDAYLLAHPLTSPPSLYPSAPATLNPWTHRKAPNNPYTVVVPRPLAAQTTASIPSNLPRNLIRFSYPPIFWAPFSLEVLYIMLETIPFSGTTQLHR